jgi:hypothetical protein
VKSRSARALPISGDLVVVDRDYALTTGYVGAGVPGAYVKSAADVGLSLDYVRRVSFNVSRVRAKTANTLLLTHHNPWNQMTEFEKQVLADLATLKTEMKLLLGNGQPGRVARLESRVEQHERVVQRMNGMGALLGVVLTLVHLGIDYFKH